MSVFSPSRCMRSKPSRHHVGLDSLESRVLLSASVYEYPVPASGLVSGSHITADFQGNLYSMSSGGGILKLNPSTGEQAFIDLPNETAAAAPLAFADVTFGADGNLWIAESFYNFEGADASQLYFGDIVKVSTSGTVLATYDLGFSQPYSPTFGADGKLYFVEMKGFTLDANNVPTYSTFVSSLSSTGALSEIAMPSDGYTSELAAADDGTIFAAFSGVYVAPIEGAPYVTPSRLGVVQGTNLAIVPLDSPAVNPHGMLLDVAVAPDGAVWLPLFTPGSDDVGTDTGVNQIVKITFDSAANPTFTSFDIPGEAPNAFLFTGAIVAATDGSVYVPEFQGQYIDRVNTATGLVDRIAIPAGMCGAASPVQVGNAIFFAEQFTGNLARIDLPVVGQGLSNAALAGEAFSGPVAILSTTLSAEDIATLSATISWGDGNTTAGTLIDNADGTVTVVGDYTYAADGSYAVDVVVTGPTIDSVRVSGETIVLGVSFAASGVPVAPQAEDAPFSALVASFIGPADAYTATINWGNGQTTTGQVVMVNGVYNVIGAASYSVQGTYAISVTITGTGNSAVVTTSVDIGDTPLQVTAVAPTLLAGKIAVGATAYFTDDVDARMSWFNASIQWGDGTKAAKGVIVSTGVAGQFMVIGTHHYKTRGTFTLTTTVTAVRGEDVGETASDSVVLVV